MCKFVVCSAMVFAGALLLASVDAKAAQSKKEIVAECQAMYGGKSNFRKRANTGMTVKQCVDQKSAKR